MLQWNSKITEFLFNATNSDANPNGFVQLVHKISDQYDFKNPEI